MNQTHGLTLKRIMGYTALVVATLALLVVLYRLYEVVLLFILSVIVAAGLRKGVAALEARRLPRSLAILVWYIVVLGVFALGIFVLGGSLARELQTLSEDLPQRYDFFIGRYRSDGGSWRESIANRLPDTNTVIQGLGEGGAAEIGFQIAGLTSGILNLVVSIVGVLTMTFYWLVDQEHFERLWLTVLPVQQRAVARHAWRSAEHRIGAYLRSEAAQFVLTVALLWIAFRALGISYPKLFALYGGVVQLIQWIGIPLTLAPLGLMAFTNPWWLVLLTGMVIVAIGALMDRFVEPRLCGDAVVHPILTVVALMILGEASGVLGMLIALPLAALLQTVLSEIVRASTSPKAITAAMEATQIQELRTRMQRLREMVPRDEDLQLQAEGMLGRADALLDRTEEVMRERATAAERNRMPETTRRRIPAIFQRPKAS